MKQNDIKPNLLILDKNNQHLIIIIDVIHSTFEAFKNTELSHVRFGLNSSKIGNNFQINPKFLFSKDDREPKQCYLIDDFHHFGPKAEKYTKNILPIVNKIKAINRFIESITDEDNNIQGYSLGFDNNLSRSLDFLRFMRGLNYEQKIENIIEYYQLGRMEQIYNSTKEQKILEDAINLKLIKPDSRQIKI